MRRGAVIILLFILLVVPFVSAGFFSDSFNKIKWKITGYSATGCMDSDGGIEPFIFGYTHGSSAGGMLDICLNAYHLRESFCTPTGGISSTVIECEHGCNAGKCNTKEECEGPEGCRLNKNYCLDEDSGNYFEKGDLYLVKVGWHDNGSDLFSHQGFDSCMDSNWLEEYICRETGKAARKFVVCPDGCSEGACVKGEKYLEAQNSNCLDSFQGPSGMERLFVKGTVSYGGKIYEDVCASKGILTEYSCDEFGLLKKANTGCVHGCEDGVCLRSSPKTEDPDTLKVESNLDNENIEKSGEVLSTESETGDEPGGEFYCSDSDGGINYSVRGNLIIEKPKINYLDYYSDYCLNAESVEDARLNGGEMVLEGNILREHYCGESNYSYEYYLCPGICSDGACVEKEISDLGLEENLTKENLSTKEEFVLCSELGGEICSVGEYCGGVISYEANDGSYNTPCCKQGNCMKIDLEIEEELPTVEMDLETCGGCVLGDLCYSYGFRKGNKFCSITNEFVLQLDKEDMCSNDFECSTNNCFEGVCKTKKIWKSFRDFLGSIF